MSEEHNNQADSALNRRQFVAKLGASAAAGAFLRRTEASEGVDPTILYRDSFGKIASASRDALATGASPPPLSSKTTGVAGVTYVEPAYVRPNILMIMVDQMRGPQWLPAGGQAAIDAIMPYTAALRRRSFVFRNYFTAATSCIPARSTLLTGLYAPQTYMYQTLNTSNLSLVPFTNKKGFPTIGNVLSQSTPGYDALWMGKWHVSAPVNGADGPGSYGFTNRYSIPGTNPAGAYPNHAGYASPNGSPNEGSMGQTLAGGFPNAPSSDPSLPIKPMFLQLSDGAIADAFVNYWLPTASASKPWFCAVSFVNPHDVCDFPYSFGLAGVNDPANQGAFGKPLGGTPANGYVPPPHAGFGPQYPTLADNTTITPLPNLYPANSQPPQGWNNADDPAAQPYGSYNSSKGYGKPTLQWYFQHYENLAFGAVGNDLPPGSQGRLNAWFTFLNYYFWAQSCVDAQIGRVLTALQNSMFANNTIVVFLSDHGELAGSHNLHSKGGALYDECMNGPLYISYAGQTTSQTLPYVCSSVDILPFLYTTALGNESWRSNSGDMVYYLRNRESISDFVFSTGPAQRRIAPNIPASDGSGNQPYILHTCDENPTAFIPSTKTRAPSHAIAFRTVDVTVNANNQPPYGGGKLGVYSQWDLCAAEPTLPDLKAPQQFEFYNYSPHPPGGGTPLPVNTSETGNHAFTDGNKPPTWAPEAALYNEAFLSTTVQNELYQLPGPVPDYITKAQATAEKNYIESTKQQLGGSCKS